MKYLLPTVAGCASVALVGTLAVTAPTAFAATSSPDVSKESLKVSEDGLNAPGARDSSDSTATAANQSATSNLPNIFKSETALAKANAPDIVNASASAATGTVENVSTGLSSGPDEAESSTESTPSESEQAPGESDISEDQGSEDTEKSEGSEGEGEKDASEKSESKDDEDISGSVRQKTEDGVNIALISDVLDVPSNNPSLIGFTFSEAKSNIRIQVRIKHGSEWGSWDTLDEEQQEEAQNKGSEPMTVSNASGVQMRILGDSAPSDAELVLVDPKRDAGDAQAVAENAPVELDQEGSESSEGADDAATDEATDAEATTAENVAATGGATVTNQNYVPGSSTVSTVAKKVSKPKIGSRKSWGAKAYKGSPDYASGIKQAVVHHTSGSNSYSAEDVPGIIRGIQAYHQQGRGWNDIGYNVVADKYGRLWQARGGDISKAVIGAHVAGHNTGTFGISVLGTYNSAAPPKKTRDAVASAIAWKFSLNGISSATKSNLVGHRDLGQTDCPGDAFYAKLGEMRSTVNSILKTGEQPSDDKKDDDKKSDDKKDDGKKSEKSKTEIEKYAAEHKLGKAVGEEKSVKGHKGAKSQKFEKGVVYWSKKTGAYHLSGAIASAYKGDAIADLGLPTSQEKGGLEDGGVAQRFENGSFYWSKETGAHYTSGTIMNYWGDKGTVKGHLGYPKSDVTYKDGRGEQLFEGARLVWAEGYGTTEFSPKGSIAGGVTDGNAPGDSAPPGDTSTDDDSPADSGEGTADDEDSKDDSKSDDKSKDDSKTGEDKSDDDSKDDSKTDEDKSDEDSKDDSKSDDKSKDDSKKDEDKKDEDKSKDDEKKKDEPTKAEKIEAQRASIIKEAKAHLGVKYVWGGTSPNSGWDCSGYTQYVYGKHGIDLPRTTSQQRYAGKEISIKDAKPGDMIWIPGHIGIISETKGQMYDAGSPRTNTTKRSYSWMLDRGAKVIRVVG